ncbi:MAG: tRNA pseudouridine(55) synthase TruB [Pirellulales bacterium]|nr:tRNA pseudouridine(55) synthase TruB [Pirellulales bacterium]
MFGILNVNKPPGWTSRDALNRVEGLVRPLKAGHAGTLDPLAKGVLVVCVGAATRLIDYVQQMPKEYAATFLLGRRSASDDVDTEVELMVDAPRPSREAIEAAVPQFVGIIEQRPPAFSAVKVEGQRSYRLARRGDVVEHAARAVEVFQLSVARYEYPELELTFRCSSGTYVRSLGRDLAAMLGTHAVMSALVRTAVGAFRIEDAMDARGPDMERLRRYLQSPLAAVPQMPRLVLSDEQVFEVQHGGLIKTDVLPAELQGTAAEAIAAVDERGELIALLKEVRPGWWKPSPNFLQSA